VLALLTSTSACEKKELPELPPATGEGAPPKTKVPTLKELGDARASEQPKSTGTRAGTGSLQALHYAALGPKQTGVISAIAVEEGDRVKKGQVLFRIDAAQSQLGVEQAKAALATAKVQQSSAQLDYDRTKALRERGSVPEDALDQVKARLDALTSQVAQAQAALSLTQRHVTDAVITSPIDGVVSEKRMNVGEIATMMPPSVVVVVQNIDVLELRARLPETSLKTVKEGAQLNVRFPAIDETRPVTIARIAPTVDARTRTIEIVAEVPNPDHRLKAGMLAEVEYSAETVAAAAPAPAPAKAKAPANAKKPAEKTAVAKKDGADHASR
jgi:RND family efflux transporter MFP subunit